MCGILGWISRNGKRIDEEVLLRAGDHIRHRGPDAHGVFVNDWIGLLHNRLSVIDVSHSADQPMFSQDKRYAIIFNGEIYNYKELREELIGFGFNFRTHSDTEVLLNAYLKFSTECVNKLRGMFAFLIVDFHKNEVFIARDHFGIKPLYIYKSGDHIILSSEIKPFSEFMQLEPDYNSYFEQIAFRYVAGSNTCFRNIRKILPGHFYVYKRDNDEFEEHAYYYLGDTFNVNNKLAKKSENEIIEEIENLLIESVRIHTRSDVGHNLELSGGVDSSLLAAILVKKLNISRLSSYSITLPGTIYDESKHQDQIVDELGLKKWQIEITNEKFTSLMEEAAYCMEVPIVHMASVCLLYLTKYSSLDSKVILTGEGADELFGGYAWYRIPPKMRILNFLYNKGFYTGEHPLMRRTAPWRYRELEKLIRGEFLLKKNLTYRESFLTEDAIADTYDKMLHYGQQTYLTTLLTRQDRMSMANGVEARVPYVDIKLYEYVNSVPSSLKFKDGHFKYILKKIAQKYLSKEIVYRTKSGFNLPFREWLKDEKFLGKYLDILTDDTAIKRGIYNPKYLRHMVDAQRSGTVDYSRRLAILIAFELWHRIFFDKNSAGKTGRELRAAKVHLPQNA